MSDLIVTCRSCNARNRKHLERLGEAPVCAKCGAPLPRGGGPVALTEAQFDRVVRASPVPVMVDFWAAWCGPCRAFAPVLEKFAGQHPDDVLVAKVDSDAAPGLSARYGIRSIPTTVLFRGGAEIARQSGAMPASMLEQWFAGTR
jgi:thioredoxin 2